MKFSRGKQIISAWERTIGKKANFFILHRNSTANYSRGR